MRSLDASGSRFVLTASGVDGVVSPEIIGTFRLAVGRNLSTHEAAELTEAARRLQVYDLGVKLLAGRARSARDLSLALRRRGASDAEAAAAITRLIELGVLDDAVFARALAHAKSSGSGVSKRRLQQDLARRGVAPATARTAIDEVAADVGLDERATALAVARKRVRALASLDRAVARRRLYAFLARRGFDGAVITFVLGAVFGPGDDASGGDDQDGPED